MKAREYLSLKIIPLQPKKCTARALGLDRATAAMARLIDCPAVHVVPAATLCTTDHWPLPHCWKDVPPMQLNMPSEVHAPVKAPELDVVVEEPVLAGDGDEDAAAGKVVSTEALGAVCERTVAKTPP